MSVNVVLQALFAFPCRKKFTFLFAASFTFRFCSFVTYENVLTSRRACDLDRLDGPSMMMTNGSVVEIQMRRVILALLAASGLAALGVQPAEAVGRRYPFCIQGEDHPGLSNCTFVSYEQCQASASGRRLYCIENPFYVGDSDGPPAYRGRGRQLPPAYPGYPRY